MKHADAISRLGPAITPAREGHHLTADKRALAEQAIASPDLSWVGCA